MHGIRGVESRLLSVGGTNCLFDVFHALNEFQSFNYNEQKSKEYSFFTVDIDY